MSPDIYHAAAFLAAVILSILAGLIIHRANGKDGRYWPPIK